MAYKNGMTYCKVISPSYYGHQDDDIIIAHANESCTDTDVYHIIENGKITYSIYETETNPEYSIIDVLYSLKHGKEFKNMKIFDHEDREDIDKLFKEEDVPNFFKHLSTNKSKL